LDAAVEDTDVLVELTLDSSEVIPVEEIENINIEVYEG